MYKVCEHLPKSITIPWHHPRAGANLFYQDLPTVPRGNRGEARGNLLSEVS
jgi:hypothetical protein